MLRFIHSADWQLGARFTQFGQRAQQLREARLDTLRRALALARQHNADALLIAGDLFEDNQVSDSLVAATLEIFRAHPDVPVYILPGNHDPHTGPDSVWQRKPFLAPAIPANVRILRDAAIHDLGGNARLIASPLHQKRSPNDPSAKLADLAATLPADTIKIGITHGSPAIESKHKPDDFPIALNAATRAGLDYLAIGHWHDWLDTLDNGRILMPGTPEPDRFANTDNGNIALVEIPAPRQPPRVQKLPVATLSWRELDYDLAPAAAAPETARAAFAATLAQHAPDPARTVLRITMKGSASPATLSETRAWLETLRAPYLASQLTDNTKLALSPAELADLQTRHPILAQVLSDIDRLETLATGNAQALMNNEECRMKNEPPASPPDSPPAPPLAPPATETPATPAGATAPSAHSTFSIIHSTLGGEAAAPAAPAAPLTLAEAQTLLASAKIDLAALPPAFFTQLRQTLLQTLQEISQ